MTLGAIVLAGGCSRRMGRDKALLPGSGGGTLLERQVALVREAGADWIRISVPSYCKVHCCLHAPTCETCDHNRLLDNCCDALYSLYSA